MTYDEAGYKAAAARENLARASASIRELEDAGFSVRLVDISIPLWMRDGTSRLPCFSETELDVNATRAVSYKEEV